MDHVFVVSRNDTTPTHDLHYVSIEADTDKALKNFETRNRGARAQFANDVNDGQAVEVKVILPVDADETSILKAFHDDLATLHLRAKLKK